MAHRTGRPAWGSSVAEKGARCSNRNAEGHVCEDVLQAAGVRRAATKALADRPMPFTETILFSHHFLLTIVAYTTP